MNRELMFSRKSDRWSTPDDLYNKYLEMGAFDPCPLDAKYDGLAIDWKPLTYVNPPYSETKKWIEKALEEIRKGHTHLCIFLVPARVDTKWFQDLIYGRHAFKFIKGRLKFGGQKNNAPFPSMIIYLT